MSDEYHLALHLGGENGRDMTLHDMNALIEYLGKIHVKRYVVCIEPATRDHLHCVYQLIEKRPNIKRDIINAMSIDTKLYPNNAIYNKKIKVGQTFEMLSGGYLQKGYKFIKTFGITHIELENGKDAYDKLVARKTIRVSKHNLIDYIVDEMKENSCPWKEALLLMMRDKKYNMYYVANTFAEEEIEMFVHFKTNEPSFDDESMMNTFFKKNNNMY